MTSVLAGGKKEDTECGGEGHVKMETKTTKESQTLPEPQRFRRKQERVLPRIFGASVTLTKL